MTTASGGLKKKRIGFIGCGAMGRALAGGLVSAGIETSVLSGADIAPENRASFERELGIQIAKDNAALVAKSDVVVLAVKPGAVAGVLRELPGGADLARPLWISIAAGIPMASLEATLPGSARVIRAMPNTPALVGAGATAYCANTAAGDDDLAAAAALFAAVGHAWRAPAETLLDAVTGLSGSGPAYVFLILEALADAGVRVGLPREAASQLAVQTVYGAARLVLESGQHPAALKDQVTSPGGTTIAGLERLAAGGVRAAIYEAVASATARSRELSAG
jgi:pyrroline-5-carboxylate reductase